MAAAEVVLLRLLLAPLLVALATLAGRRWGGSVAGWLVGFPFTSAPIALILTVEQGPHFAAAAALGTLLGTSSQAAFALAYGRVAERGGGWAACLAAASGTFALATVLLLAPGWEPLPAALLAAASISSALLLLPRPRELPAVRPPGRYDLPARMLVATAFVVLLTQVAPLVGPRAAGLVSPFPLYGSVLAVFAHRAQGPAGALAVVRGLAAGLYGFASFFLVLALALVPLGPVPAFALALLAVGIVQAAALVMLRRG